MDREEYQRLLAQLTALEAKYRQHADAGLAHDVTVRHQPGAERTLRDHPRGLPTPAYQALIDIALLCQKAVAQPPCGTLHQHYFLEIARVCKRLLQGH